MHGILGLSQKDLEKIVKTLNKKRITREKIKIFYAQCVKKISLKVIKFKGKHLSKEERVTIEILFTARF